MWCWCWPRWRCRRWPAPQQARTSRTPVRFPARGNRPTLSIPEPLYYTTTLPNAFFQNVIHIRYSKNKVTLHNVAVHSSRKHTRTVQMFLNINISCSKHSRAVWRSLEISASYQLRYRLTKTDAMDLVGLDNLSLSFAKFHIYLHNTESRTLGGWILKLYKSSCVVAEGGFRHDVMDAASVCWLCFRALDA